MKERVDEGKPFATMGISKMSVLDSKLRELQAKKIKYLECQLQECQLQLRKLKMNHPDLITRKSNLRDNFNKAKSEDEKDNARC